ncbi:MAG: low molecular weight protein tyrosine phosphatase family protein [Oscillospiraceae bacterium]
MKILYLCSQNKRRSLTAEKVLNGRDGHEVRSAGTENNARIKVTAGLLGWADIIVTMEKKHTSRIKSKYADIVLSKPIVCLHISDDYQFMDELLIKLLEDNFETLIN